MADELAVRCARGRLANDDVKNHRIALADFPSVRMALESRRTRVLEAQIDHEARGLQRPLDQPERDLHLLAALAGLSPDRHLF